MGTCSTKQGAVVEPVTIIKPCKPLQVTPAAESWSTLRAFEPAASPSQVSQDGNMTPHSKTAFKTVSSTQQSPKIFHRKSPMMQTRAEFLLSNNSPGSSRSSTPLFLKSGSVHSSPHASRRDTHNLRRALVSQRLKKTNIKHPVTLQTIPTYLLSLQPPASPSEVSSIGSIESSTSKTNPEREQILQQDKKKHQLCNATVTPTSRPTSLSSLDARQCTASPAMIQEGVSQRERSNESVFSVLEVDCTIPDYFHPSCQKKDVEVQCQNIATMLLPKRSEVPFREEIQQLLIQWDMSRQLAEIENHALSIPASQTSTIEVLANGLTAAHAKYVRNLGGNQLHLLIAKAYAIYYWVANNIRYSVETWQDYLSGANTQNTDAKTVLQERTSVCTGYANLYQALAIAAGLEAKVIHGNVKLWRHLSQEGPESVFEPSRTNAHFWNAVKVGSTWFPIDCTFGSGSMTSTTHFISKYTASYFAVPPERMILTHFPSDETWQMLETPVSLQDIQPLIAPHNQVFALGVDPKVWNECIHITDCDADPVIHIHLKAKPGLRLLAKIIDNDSLPMQTIQKGAPPDSSGSARDSYIQQCKGDTCMNAVVPHRGRFSFNIYASDFETESQNKQHYQLCLSYQIWCEVGFESQIGYPLVYDLAASAFDFELLHWNLPHKSYVSSNEQGKLEIAFRAQPGLKYYHCLFSGKVKGHDNSTSSYAKLYHTMLVHDANDPTLHALQAVFPSEGWWTIYLCASRPSDIEGTTGYTALLNYHVMARGSLPKHAYPHLFSEGICFDSPKPITASGTELLLVPFVCNRLLDFHCYLTYEHPTGMSMEEFTKVDTVKQSPQSAGTKYLLKVIFPKPGKWYVHVFARDLSVLNTQSFSGLFDLHIEVDGSMKNAVFPSLNSTISEEMNIRLPTSDPVVFPDDGNPFTFQFLAPRDVSFMHKVEPASAQSDGETSPFMNHCTYLLSSTIPGNLNTYTLKAVFPSAGKWNVQLFAGGDNAAQYDVAVQVVLEVAIPSPGIGFPKLYPAFHHLGLSIPEESQQYSMNLDTAEFKLPFYAPENLHFVWSMQFASTNEKLYQQAFVHYPNRKQPNSYALHLSFSKPGDWLVQVFARKTDTASNGGNYQSVFDLRVNAMAFSSDYAFPQIFEPFRGTFAMEIQDDALPLLSRVHSTPQTVVIPFYSPSNVRFWHDAEVEGKGSQETSRMTSKTETGLHELDIEITENGKWTITVYAQYINATNKNWTAVLRHVIHADS